ncbi:Gp138 family membrane-puncturing spike protein [Pseudomonas baetica]|uniref:Gp138 family membrane-puncturing spike protein n=1 Tax=Pseudomonas baetica TaxID=674054 RepID=UPI003EED811F
MPDILGMINNQIRAENHAAEQCFLARVTGVDMNNLTVNVQMLTLRYDADGDTEDDVPVLGVPLVMPSSSTSAITFPVQVGDVVVCVVSSSSIDNFKISNGQQMLPTEVNDYRRFNAQDAIAFPYSKRANNTQYTFPHDPNDVSITHNIGTGNECTVVLKADGNVEVASPFTVKVKAKDIELEADNSLSLKAQTMTINVPNTTWTGNYAMTGEATFNGIPFSTHKHTGVTPGSGTTATPVA